MSTTAVLPLFPLNTVLFPDGPLSLRIFEPRYVDMVSRCMREGSPFGVVTIRSGAEVGPVAEMADIGTTARIHDFGTLPDGLLGLSCRGERKFHIERRWCQDDGLNLAEVLYLPEEPPCAIPEEHRWASELLAEVLPQLKETYSAIPARLEDATWVGCRLAEILRLDREKRLALLALSDPVARLAELAALRPR
jgi:Lon protease-like protein